MKNDRLARVAFTDRESGATLVITIVNRDLLLTVITGNHFLISVNMPVTSKLTTILY